MFNGDKKWVVYFGFGIILIVLSIVTINTNKKVNQLQKQLDDQLKEQKDLVSDVNRYFGYIQTYIRDFDDELSQLIELKENEKWIYNESFSVLRLTEGQENIVDVKINFTLRELSSSSKVFLSIINKEDESDTQKIEVPSDTLTFEATVQLSSLKNYHIDIFTEDNNINKSGSLMDIYLNRMVSNRLRVSSSFSYRDDDNNGSYEINILNNYMGVEEYKFEKVTLYIYIGSTRVDTIEITNPANYSQYGTNEYEYFKYPSDIVYDLDKVLKIEMIIEDGTGKEFNELIVFYEPPRNQ